MEVRMGRGGESKNRPKREGPLCGFFTGEEVEVARIIASLPQLIKAKSEFSGRFRGLRFWLWKKRRSAVAFPVVAPPPTPPRIPSRPPSPLAVELEFYRPQRLLRRDLPVEI
ncbi:unnamed protein product [Cuscuta campestris]|uniref:Uncharacterized protein n=1 Tax=Cuscuta campestris TaxID=132261 RepID=A0A484KJ70_9ASTE|nr:unnamed protein product [Cuscuta campestris]